MVRFADIKKNINVYVLTYVKQHFYNNGSLLKLTASILFLK